MRKEEKIRVSWEVAKVMIEYPQVGKMLLAQQMILQEVAESGVGVVEDRIKGVLEVGMGVLFLEYWRQRCSREAPELPASLQCLARARYPRDCFGLRSDEWLDDPFAEGRRFAENARQPSY